MAEQQPSSRLSQVLASGGELSVAKGITRGLSPVQIAALIRRRFGDLTDSEIGLLMQMSSNMIASAVNITNLHPDDEIPLEDIPVNPSLFGDDWAGKRLEFSGEWRVTGTDDWFSIRIDLPDTVTVQELFDAITSRVSGFLGESPGAFGDDSEPDDVTIDIRITTSERRF